MQKKDCRGKSVILVTGTTGYVGRHLVPYLLDMGFSIFPLGRDLSVIDKIENLPNTVIHLAGKIQISLKKNPLNAIFPPIPGEADIQGLFNSNIIFSKEILDYCIINKVNHIVYASSQTVYGMPEKETVTEDSKCDPLEFYALTKLCAEYLLHIAVKYGISVTTLRFPGIYGGDKKNGTVYRFCHSAVKDKKIEVDIDYPLPFDVIHIEDVIEVITKSIWLRPKSARIRCFNIATGEPCSLDILADSIAELVPGCEVKHSLVPQPVIRMNSDRAEILLDWKAIPRRERLSDLCQHIQNQI